ncbi:MAG: lysophospholipid acyltransferase family protein [Acidobacteriota bacterium]
MDWNYAIVTDSNRSLVERLKTCRRKSDSLVYAARLIIAVAIRIALRLYNRFDIVGREHLPRDGSFVLVANHASHLDAVALLAALPLRSLHSAYPLAARDYFCANRLRLALTTIIANVMLFDRDARGKQTLKLCQQMLAKPNNIFLIFPEGTRSIDGRIGRFRRGVGLLLAGTAYRVVPCYLDGTGRALPKGAWIPRPERIRLTIGEARTYERIEQTDDGALRVCADLRSAVLALSSENWLPATQPISQEFNR